MDQVQREVCLVTPAFWQLVFVLSVRTLVIQETDNLMVNIKGPEDHDIVCSILINVMRFLVQGIYFSDEKTDIMLCFLVSICWSQKSFWF
jgi:hypothetical protein